MFTGSCFAISLAAVVFTLCFTVHLLVGIELDECDSPFVLEWNFTLMVLSALGLILVAIEVFS